MCQNSPPPNAGLGVAGIQNNPGTLSNSVKNAVAFNWIVVLRGFLPHVCNQHVYRFEHNNGKRLDITKLVYYCKWIFYNDMSVQLRVILDESCMDGSLTDMREHMTVEHEDYEAWMADAIMRCEAGEDIWERPSRFGGNSSGQQSAQQQMQSGIGNQLQSGLIPSIGQAMCISGVLK